MILFPAAEGLLGAAFIDLQNSTTNQFYVVPLDGQQKEPQIFNSSEAFFHLHTINTFRDEKTGDVVVDLEVSKTHINMTDRAPYRLTSCRLFYFACCLLNLHCQQT